MAVKKLTEDQRKLLGQWRVEALEIMPYMAHILFALRPFDSTSTNSFACDDRYRLYINFKHVEREFSTRLAVEALLHECAHLFADDKARGDEAGALSTAADRKRWNRACDAANNDDLVEAGCVALGEYGVLPEHLGADRHLTAESYYAMISQRSGSDDDGDESDGDGDDDELDGVDGDESDGDGGDESDDDGGDDGDESDGDGDESDGDGDDDESDDNCGSASGNRSVAEDDDTGDPGLSDIEREMKKIATAGSIREYESRYPGTIPGRLSMLAELTLAPSVVPWQQVLSSHVRRAVSTRPGNDYNTYSRRNRRTPSFNGVAMPGTVSPMLRVVVIRDTSGSMDEQLFQVVTNEVVGIAQKLGVRGRDMMVLDVDTIVQNIITYRRTTDLNVRSGVGGTDMRVGIAAAAELRPSVIVVLTDGYTPWPDEPNGIPLVVCVVGGGDQSSFPAPTWARVVRVSA